MREIKHKVFYYFLTLFSIIMALYRNTSAIMEICTVGVYAHSLTYHRFSK